MSETVDNLRGKSVLLLGGSRGLGLCVAEKLVTAGSRVMLVGRDPTRLAAAAALVKTGAYPITIGLCDLSQEESVNNFLSSYVRDAAPIDIVFCNASSLLSLGPTAMVSYQDWVVSWALVKGFFHIVHAMLPDMIRRDYGNILIVSSTSGIIPGLTCANAYSVAKAALEMFALNLAKELEGSGIYINVLRPGLMDTEMQAEARSQDPDVVGEAFVRKFNAFTANGLLRNPSEAAQVVLNIFHKEATGTITSIDQRGVSITKPERW